MSLVGHKAVSSLAIYEKVNSEEKLNIGYTHGYKLLNPTYRLEPVMSIPQVPAIMPNYNQDQILSMDTDPPAMLPGSPKNPPVVVQNKENVTLTNAIIPFEPENPIPSDDGNFSDVPDFDLVRLINEAEVKVSLLCLKWNQRETQQEVCLKL